MEEDKPNYYAIIPSNVRYDTNLKANEKLLYGEITALVNQSGKCWASNSYFSKLYNVSKETVSRWIMNLKNNGYISVECVRNSETKEVEKRVIETLVKSPIELYSLNNEQQNPSRELADNFDKIWKIYPRKDGKNTAFNHYKTWIKGKKYAGRTIKLTNKQMWLATKKYADLVIQEKREKQFIKMGSTFFNEAIMEYVEEEN